MACKIFENLCTFIGKHAAQLLATRKTGSLTRHATCSLTFLLMFFGNLSDISSGFFPQQRKGVFSPEKLGCALVQAPGQVLRGFFIYF
jgi:hypothetical protein